MGARRVPRIAGDIVRTRFGDVVLFVHGRSGRQNGQGALAGGPECVQC